MTWRINRFRITDAVSLSSDKTSEISMPKHSTLSGSWRRYWQLGMVMALGVSGAIGMLCDRANSQSNIIPDSTLGNESSIVVPNFQGFPVEAIAGGAARGQNLFHSFVEFNVSAGRGAYFFSPNSNIVNILARITGTNPSQILGTIGTFGNSQPNLFLINPKGIIFGPNASLDVGGSFVATTANAIRLGDTGLFSATQPTTSNLLTINPSAFFYNQLSNQGQIVNRSTATTTVLGVPTSGLQVPDGRSLLLVGGDVRSEGGRLFAPGGRVELGGVAQNGTVELSANGNELGLIFPADVIRANVFLTNQAEVNVRAGGGGNIAINAGNLEILGGSKVRAGIASGLGVPESKAGDIEVNATGTVTVAGELSFMSNGVLAGGVGKAGDINITTGSLFVKEGGYLIASTQGRGDAGNVMILARDIVSFDSTDPNGGSSAAVSTVEEGAVGKGGDIDITTGSLFVTNGAELSTGTAGQGKSGSVRIRTRDTVRFDGGEAFSDVAVGAVGDGGDIEITTGSLEVTNGAQLIANTAGQGNAGSIRIRANNSVRFGGIDSNGFPSKASSSVRPGAVGDGGEVEITTGSLSVGNGGFLSASTYGQGNAGSVRIRATDTVNFDGGRASSSVGTGAVRDGGDIEITTGSLSLTNGANLSASTYGQGNAGSVRIRVTNTVSVDGGYVNSTVGTTGVGNGGDIEINTSSLSVRNSSGLNTSTYGQGNAGSVRIRAIDSVRFDGSIASSLVDSEAVGDGGDIEITTGSLSVSNDAYLFADTDGQGNAGSVRIYATDTVNFDRGGASSMVGKAGVGNGGDIEITSGSLSVTNSANLYASTFGQGNAGSVRITATDAVRFDGGKVSSAVLPGAVGDGGDIEITTGSLSVSNGAFLTASTGGQGKAGGVRIRATDSVRFDGGIAASFVALGAVGNGGDIEITTGSLSVTNGAQLSASTFGRGNAGGVKITATDQVRFDGVGTNGQSSAAFSTVEAGALGDGGDIVINTGSLSVTNGAVLSGQTNGQGNAGNIKIKATDEVRFDGVGSNGQFSGAFSAVGAGGQGEGGEIEITSGSLSLTGAVISSVSLGKGTAGDITLSTRQNLETNRSRILATTQSGNGGNINLQVGDILLMRNASNISTTAGSPGAGGNGGNIDINADFIVAVPKENSDITANAFGGKGGNINITTQGIYGLEFRPQLTPMSDITASSDIGLNGEFLLTLLTDVDATRGLAQLPSNVIDASNQIDRRCASGAAGRSSFTITGRGGIPPSPNDVLQAESVITPNWVTLDSQKENNTTSTQTTPRSSTPTQLVEANGWIINHKGQVELIATAPNVTPHGEWLPEPECNPSPTP